MRIEFENVRNCVRGEFENARNYVRGDFKNVRNYMRGEFEPLNLKCLQQIPKHSLMDQIWGKWYRYFFSTPPPRQISRFPTS